MFSARRRTCTVEPAGLEARSTQTTVDEADSANGWQAALGALVGVGVLVGVEAASFAIDAAEGALRAGEPKRAFGPATVAATISRRPFLSGDESAWARREREKLARQRVRALECQAEVWLANGEPPLAVEAAREALTIEPFRESAYRLLMRSHALAGNRAEGVLAYHDLRSRLVSELGTDPSKETEAVYLELLA